MRRLASDRAHGNHPLHLVDIVEDAMLADSQLPDRRRLLERWRQLPEPLDVLRRSCRFVPQLALYTVQDRPPFGSAEHIEIAHHTGGEADFVHAYVFADA